MNRFERQIAFFGIEGQKKLQQIVVGVVGVGGIGSHVIQQLAFLGIPSMVVIDDDELAESNANRLIGFTFSDTPGTPKVDIAERTARQIDPTIEVLKVKNNVNSREAIDALMKCNFIFGCVDNDGARLFLNEFCLAFSKPYIDSASEIKASSPDFGGRIVSIIDEPGCLYCLNEISVREASKYLASKEARRDQELIYGMDAAAFQNSGPSVVTLNGIIASLATTEFLVHVTNQRKINKKITYYGAQGVARKNSDLPPDDCYYCQSIKGKGKDAHIERYISK
jgi:molybdopterin/thiamine biosynthesis adenylyltransferase